jgi:hypothetical protein
MQVVPVEEEPVSGVVVGVVTEQPGPSSGYVDQTLAMLDGLADEGGRGSLEFLGRWNDKRDDHAMPVKLIARNVRHTGPMVRVAFCKLVDELVQNNASSGTLAISNLTISNRKEVYHASSEYEMDYEYTAWDIFWSTSPDDTSYQRHGFVGMESDQSENIRFADFKGVVDDFEGEDQIAVYRVTLPRGGLDPDKWVGRPPPPAPADLYTGPRSDGLLSTDEISGEYSAPGCICADGPGYKGCPVIKFCNSMSVVPLGADTIETWRASCCFLPPFIGPVAYGEVRTRDPGTNAFDGMTFSADGTAKSGCGYFKKRPGSQKRAFHKVETRDLAGKWRGCECVPFVPCWPFSGIRWTEKTALNQDRYEESGHRCCLALPLPCSVESTTRTRVYVNGHPTNGFYEDGTWYGGWYSEMNRNPDHIHWHRDAGCAGDSCSFAKKVG